VDNRKHGYACHPRVGHRSGKRFHLIAGTRAGDEVVIEHNARPVAVLRAAAPGQSIDESFAAIAQTVPAEDWERVPPDLAKNLDHYLYGTSK
jgi:antitoxin (DNA-binding transcriptional repressor) of toxin-antitoxin stability system